MLHHFAMTRGRFGLIGSMLEMLYTRSRYANQIITKQVKIEASINLKRRGQSNLPSIFMPIMRKQIMKICKTEEEYIDAIAPAACAAVKKIGGYIPSVLIAQSCLGKTRRQKCLSK